MREEKGEGAGEGEEGARRLQHCEPRISGGKGVGGRGGGGQRAGSGGQRIVNQGGQFGRGRDVVGEGEEVGESLGLPGAPVLLAGGPEW